jgi:hypothetical protein
MPALRIGFNPAHAAAVCAFAVDALYVALISQQGNGIDSRVVFVAGGLAVAGVAAGTAGGICAFPGGLAAAWAAATLWIWVLLSAASIGILIVPAAIFATIALTRRQAPAVAITSGIALAFLTAAAGLAWTS